MDARLSWISINNLQINYAPLQVNNRYPRDNLMFEKGISILALAAVFRESYSISFASIADVGGWKAFFSKGAGYFCFSTIKTLANCY